jgi:5-methylcytosine-specific restriction endonuclease McrA
MAGSDDMNARDRLRQHFLANVGKTMDSEELREVGGISEWARRIRELRDEEGYQIKTHNDLAELKPGQYRLDSTHPIPSFERDVSKETRALVLDRNGYTCQMCGAAAGEVHPFDPRRKTRLHIGHIQDKSHRGSDDLTNLRAVCSVCNEGAANITADRPSAIKLLSQVRRAGVADQLEVMKWLIKKFPKPAKSELDG